MKVAVPGKINLHLQVVGKRADGFHELRTLFQSVDLCDVLVAERAPEGELGLEVEPDTSGLAGEHNLVLKAARCLWRFTGRAPGARLTLNKRIPVGGGLGGGSADAAAALVLLNRLWNLNVEIGAMVELAAELGSDVPFFLAGGTALGVGRGDEVVPLVDLAPFGVLILTPPVEVCTAEVFSRVGWDGKWGRTAGSVYASVVSFEPPIRWSGMVNDLEAVVCAGWPQVAEALESLRRLDPLRAAVTGSGASVFAVFPSVEHARKAASGLETPFRLELCRMLNRDQAQLVIRGADSADQEVGRESAERKLEVVRGDN